MNEDRTSSINIGGVQFPLILTTKATKEIGKRYGGLENLGEKLMKSDKFEKALDEITWLIALLANQAILIHNFQHRDDKAGQKELLTEEEIELMTTPYDLGHYKDAIINTMQLGTQRMVESEREIGEGKNGEGA